MRERARWPLILVIVFVLAALSAPVSAQGGSATDVLTGRVIGPAGEPIAGAGVVATSLERGIQRATLTNAQGRYTLLFPDGDGAYELQVTRIGMRTERLFVVRTAGSEVILIDVRLAVAPVVLAEITVLGEGTRPDLEAHERVFEGEWLTLLPIDPSDLATIASLQAGVVGLEANDSVGSGGFSVFGQRPDLNHVSLDGATFGSPRGADGGGLGIPAEAVRLTRVITNNYDVARGQFSGGQIATTTRGGSNRPQGSIAYSLYEPRLQWHPEGSPFSRAYTQHRVSGGYGGPIVRDRLFYFGSASAQHRTQGLASLMQADASALAQLGAHPDSVDRFLQILRDHGLAPNEPVAASAQLVEEVTGFARFDAVLSERHSLMMRGDGRWQRRDGTRVSSLGLPHSGGNNRTLGGGLMLSATSRFGDLVNEFRAYYSVLDSDQAPYFPVPEGRVRVTSHLPDGSRSVSSLVFGGNRALPVISNERTLEVSNEVSRFFGDRHRLKLGALVNVTRSAQEFSQAQHGSFSFNSLDEFENNLPSSFNRSLTTALKEGGGLNAAVYLGDTWQARRSLQLTYGLRWEASRFAVAPDFNPIVASLFDRRTDEFPSEINVSPRFGFTYLIGADSLGRSPRTTVRGGVGEFRGRPPFSLFSTALDATGLPSGQLQIACVGSAVPMPDWHSYRNGAGAIPEACAGGEIIQPSSGSVRNVTVFSPNFRAPRSWRTSIGVEHRLSGNHTASLEATYNLGRSLYGVVDRNLHADPRFFVAEEDGRPVFVDPAEIVPTTGRVGLLSSRVHPELGQVLEIHSGLESRAAQLSVDMRGTLPGRVSYRAAYALGRAIEQSPFSCCSAQQGFNSAATAGDPNTAEWGTAQGDRRHAVTLTSTVPIRPWVQVTVVGRSTSGAPFTPLVGGDVNADGARNDRAFVFDPLDASDPAVGAGMTRLLDSAPHRVRRCLQAQLGRIAERNSCREPWQHSLELRANLRLDLPHIGRRLNASIASQNLLTGIDYAVNGWSGLRGWGQRSSPDVTLLYVRAFDPETLHFGYEVNERFGDSRQGRIAFGSPFQLHLEGRLEIGPGRGR
jgi:hypothetical protein